ncbi:hypothetical protein Q8F55_000341 [Vanrija albida]|uniref:Uncharacterized protein n=1 Tax=Vanrija albida TaxID=181172 RepID=A0ABR3QD05_9TREE
MFAHRHRRSNGSLAPPGFASARGRRPTPAAHPIPATTRPVVVAAPRPVVVAAPVVPAVVVTPATPVVVRRRRLCGLF